MLIDGNFPAASAELLALACMTEQGYPVGVGIFEDLGRSIDRLVLSSARGTEVAFCLQSMSP
jgi:hypothetical protein